MNIKKAKVIKCSTITHKVCEALKVMQVQLLSRVIGDKYQPELDYFFITNMVEKIIR